MEEDAPLQDPVMTLPRRFAQEALPRLRRATLPFYGLENERIFRDRNGVFLRVADRHFILTAAHYLREWVQENTPLFVGRNPQDGGLPIPIVGSTVHTTDANELDVAVIQLSRDEATAICGEYAPISILEVATGVDRTPACFAVVGYPQEWLHRNEDGICSPALVYMTSLFDGDRVESDDNDLIFSSERHVVFDFPRTAIHIPSGEDKELPSRKGMGGISGCGV